ncbi:hypothetical protein EFR84_15040 [Rhizobium chutanense]|uniref:Uncharacterized protein n=1 Tax=Rhizobium chutanense TaxID=2035448 RepID=A0A432P1Y4_9HYPH|nr:hypothetical protein EFR84_15040 [Rhizobium chutanense]
MVYRPRQNATAINFRMGSGGRLTSRRCHEITWPFCVHRWSNLKSPSSGSCRGTETRRSAASRARDHLRTPPTSAAFCGAHCR